MTIKESINQNELTSVVCARPQNFVWFLGAGASRSAGLPTATDILWDLKRQYYCREENQEITRQDIQNDAVRTRIQTFMESRGFPAEWADAEYETYFEKIFGDDKEKQRRYVGAVLAEDKVRLASGHRVLGAMIALGLCRVSFTTNFDTVVEKAVATVSGKSLAAYHLEGAHNAKQALDNEDYPFYCKLHGDFRHDSLKNLPADLAVQNASLSQCLTNAGTRFGFIVAGYSGRDASVLALFRAVLETTNPFPHGLFWTHLKGSQVPEQVHQLIVDARAKGVNASTIPIETFDSMMMRVWRNIQTKSPEMDAKVRRTSAATVSISMPGAGTHSPLLRMNALPVASRPQKCLELAFRKPMEWADLREVQSERELEVIFTKGENVWCWGKEAELREAFGDNLLSLKERDLPTDLSAPGNLHVQGFLEEALVVALARDRPLLSRKSRTGALLIVDPQATDVGALNPLFDVVGKTHGEVIGLVAPVTDEYPRPVKVTWAESVRLTLDHKEGNLWVQLDPDVWIWPQRARESAVAFLTKRRGDRLNKKYNSLLNAWLEIIFASDERNVEIDVTAFESGSDAGNPKFRLNNRTAFARRLVG